MTKAKELLDICEGLENINEDHMIQTINRGDVDMYDRAEADKVFGGNNWKEVARSSAVSSGSMSMPSKVEKGAQELYQKHGNDVIFTYEGGDYKFMGGDKYGFNWLFKIN